MSRLLFAKVFDTKHGQLLVYKGQSEEGDPALHFVCQPIEEDEMQVTLSPSFEDSEEGCDLRDAAFDKVAQVAAESMAQNLYNQLADMGMIDNESEE